MGELSLTGRLRPISGVLPMAMAAARAGIRQLYVPAENAAEATLAEGMTVYGVENVEQLVAYLRGTIISPLLLSGSRRVPGRWADRTLPTSWARKT